MSTAVRIAAFVAAVVAVFATALVVGRGIGPIGDNGEGAEAMDHTSAGTAPEGAESAEDAMEDAMEVPGGLMVSSGGYTFDLGQQTAAPGTGVPLSFRILGPDGEPVTGYDVEHAKELHLIAVRRDLTGFQHVHPTLATDGTWSTDLALTPGDWRLFADFKPTDVDALTLGADLPVAGRYQPAASPGESRTSAVDGYQVTIDGELVAGTDSRLRLTVTKDGKPVTDLEPYLGAYGHLVALREGDLAYLHVHPDGTPGDGTTEPGPAVAFVAEVPSAGAYRLFLDFQHDGVVRTASFALSAEASEAAEPPEPSDSTPTESTPFESTPSESGHNGH
ncbi:MULTISPECIES: hypothetical protein [unclassified Nocardioides]|uniref:hypothetical protein n=1 Tax=unclassified Nocardioides TaxID=2615069 RepID=UPI0009F05FFE|nr:MULTISPECIES: hypothetical protein [unclassified Nocardioides]GAW49749.1 Putative uncharacterized protein [Nocardioides sp. PD653-B2]GAW56511.1 putative uncharacterized protein [Nocardioides sp. PD653]